MALTDPQSITYDGTATPLARIDSAGRPGVYYLSADGAIELSIKHQYGARTRRVVRTGRNSVIPNPFIPSQNIKVANGVYTVVDVNTASTVAEVQKLLQAHLAMLSASTYAMANKIVNGES